MSGTQEGGAIPGGGDPAFTLHVPEGLSVPVLIAAPHGGRNYPPGVIQSMREPEWSTLRLEDRLVDRLAREVARECGSASLLAHAPRAIIDLNRDPDDVDWSMIDGHGRGKVRPSPVNRRSRSGLGLVPRRLPGLGEVWKSQLANGDLIERIDKIHRPYHEALKATLGRLRDRWGAALLVDLHSMPPLKARGIDDQPAEFVLGDRFGSSCNEVLSATALRYLASAERRVSHNRPYSGGYVLERHGSPRQGLHAIQLEVCRSAYLDGSLRREGPRFAGVVKLLAGMVRSLAVETASLGDDESFQAAAE